ncbi:MAG: hypothetical protein IJD10_07200, partial [Clostridia bacterium]|nr:hypothetical protein [Clostridia bacterium]
SLLTPIAEQTADQVHVTVSIPYQASDPANALYGYVLARKDENGSYLPMSETMYPSNFAEFAQHRQEYPVIPSKKGLQIQLHTDAQLLGVKHTVVNVFFNEMISASEKDAIAFVYGGMKYYLKSSALAALDYRIRSLTDAGIHIYLNFLLAFDTSAPTELYYANAEGTGSTLYAPNVSDLEGIHRYAAVMHYLASRYTEPDGKHGFCGSYIIGYEIDQEKDRNNAGIASLSEYISEYAILLRTADTAVRSAFENGRVYTSLSNRWVIPQEEAKAYRFGARDILSELASRLPDVPFGVSINPYPSQLTMTDYWNDDKATSNIDSPYLTMKNLTVFTDYLKTDALLYQGAPRRALVGEFGLSGKAGESEELQAAAFLYAYHTVRRNDGIEAMIWHRHVDHAGEKGLYYGLYSSTEILLHPQAPKLLHSVFSQVDDKYASWESTLDTLLALTPCSSREELWGDIDPHANRSVFRVSPRLDALAAGAYRSQSLFDFSKSLYRFYPTDNAEYLEQCEEDNVLFLRSKLIHISAGEHMGVGMTLTDTTLLNAAEYLTIRLRVVSPDDTSDVRLLLVSQGDEAEMVWDAQASVACDQWVELTFPLSGFAASESSTAVFKIWTRSDSSSGQDLFLDVASVTLQTATHTSTLSAVFLILVIVAASAAVAFLTFLFVARQIKKRRAA